MITQLLTFVSIIAFHFVIFGFILFLGQFNRNNPSKQSQAADNVVPISHSTPTTSGGKIRNQTDSRVRQLIKFLSKREKYNTVDWVGHHQIRRNTFKKQIPFSSNCYTDVRKELNFRTSPQRFSCMHEEMLQRQSRMHHLSEKRESAANQVTEERVLEMPSDVSVEFNPITPPSAEQCDDTNFQGSPQ